MSCEPCFGGTEFPPLENHRVPDPAILNKMESRKPTEHRLPSVLLQRKVRVAVVGCGGTGSAIAAGLPHLHHAMLAWGHPHGLDVTLIDGDWISRTNCVRQPFSESEMGLYKSTVLATRINGKSCFTCSRDSTRGIPARVNCHRSARRPLCRSARPSDIDIRSIACCRSRCRRIRESVPT